MARSLFLTCLAAAAAIGAGQETTDIAADLESYEGNLTTLHTIVAPSWVSSSPLRGSASILYSCLITLLACVYTALHLNIPERGTSAWRQFLTKLRWVFCAVCAPEMVVYMALTQFLEARKLAKELRSIAKERQEAVREVRARPQKYHHPPTFGNMALMLDFERMHRLISSTASSYRWAESSSRANTFLNRHPLGPPSSSCLPGRAIF